MVLLSLCILISGSDEKLQPARRYNTNPAISASLPTSEFSQIFLHIYFILLFYFNFLFLLFAVGLKYFPVYYRTIFDFNTVTSGAIKIYRVVGRMQGLNLGLLQSCH
jgi:hypothetical protein